MNRLKLDNIFDQFKKSRHWERLPNLQKGCMLKSLEDARKSEKTARELHDFLEKIMNTRPKLNIPLRK